VSPVSRVSQSAAVAALFLTLVACQTAQPRPAPRPGPATVVAQLEGPPVAAPQFGTPSRTTIPGASRGTDLAPAPGAAAADSPPTGRTATLNAKLLREISPPTGDADLPVGPGDLLEISVFEVEELSKIKVRIPMKGTITLPLLGQIRATGLSPLELQDQISDLLQQKYMHNPQVSVFVHEHTSQRVSVMGAVRKGGVYTLTSRLRLADALAMADGLAEEADHTIYLIRQVPMGTVTPGRTEVAPPRTAVPPLPGATEEIMVAINLDELTAGREELNVPLQAGDVVYVARAGWYYVGGSVEKPGPFFLRSKTTVQQAITAAGGPRDIADWADIRLYRTKANGEREVLTFSLNEFEKDQAPPEIQKDDIVVVGKSQVKAFWYGVYDFFKGILGISKPL
jgi:polysaccharide biosynthesis/export protein